MKQQIKGITATVLFESASLNRGEKIAGNITTIKKIARENGVFPYMSREFMRHHLFNTIKYCFDWHDAPVMTAKDVIQFSFPEANIIMYPEMDLFGFMTTDKPVVTRKASLGLTKAIALETWQSSMAFGANHDMVRRIKESGQAGEPNPHQKEEHYGYYKVSFTLDLCRFGYSENVLPEVAKDNRIIKWFEQQQPVTDIIDITKHCSLIKADKLQGFEWKQFVIGETVLGFVGLETKKDPRTIIFAVTDEQRKIRLIQLLTVLKSGLMLHSDTENYGVVPQFIVCACLSIPVPVLNDFVALKDGLVNKKDLEYGLTNAYIKKAWYDGVLTSGENYANQNAQAGFSIDEVINLIFPQENA